MSYNILEARIDFLHGELQRVVVLVAMSKGDIRAIAAVNRPSNGYTSLHPNERICNEVLQRVAAYGCETNQRDKLFPAWRSRHKKAITAIA